MTSLIDGTKNTFNQIDFYSPTTMRFAGGVIACTVIAYSIYLRHRPSVGTRTPTQANTTVVKDGPRTFEYLSTPKRLLLEYRGGAPEQANEEFKRAMANAIKVFFNINHQRLSHQLPETSSFNTMIYSGNSANTQTGNWTTAITHRIDKNHYSYNLDVAVDGTPGNSQWKEIDDLLLDWRSAFSLNEGYF